MFRMTNTNRYCLLPGWIFLFALPGALYAQNPRDILNRYLDTVSNGSIENWNRITSVYIESISLYDHQIFETGSKNSILEQPLSYGKLYKVWPDKEKSELYSDSSFSTLTSSFYFLRDRHFIIVGNVPVTSPVQKHLWFDFYPVKIHDYIRRSKSIRLNGITEFPNDSISCYEIDIRTADRDYRVYINTQSYLLEAQYIFETDSFVRLYNYQQFGDLLIALGQATDRNGAIYAWKKYTRIKINPDIDPEIFSLPR